MKKKDTLDATFKFRLPKEQLEQLQEHYGNISALFRQFADILCRKAEE